MENFKSIMKYDYLIVGAGLYGCTFAYLAYKKGKKCLVIDKRPQLGGNLYCKNIYGINVHQYGAHIFHTSNREVWDFVNSIVEFNRYTNSPVANYKDKLYNLPFNMNTFYQMWGTTTPDEAMYRINSERQEMKTYLESIGVKSPRNLEEQAILLIGKTVYERLIKGYTEKQWGRKCTELPAFIIKRLPVRMIFDNNYFNDKYQGIPVGGYNKLIDGLLEGSDTMTGVDFFKLKKSGLLKNTGDEYECQLSNGCCNFKSIVFTGKIDEYFDYQFGKLNYRTVRFEQEVLDKSNYQGNAVVNYTDAAVPYTRIIEHKHFEMFGDDVYDVPKTVISREYSTEWQDGMEPYYPVNDEHNNRLYAEYKILADKESNVLFGGRLAEYKYYDMDDIIGKVIKTVNNK